MNIGLIDIDRKKFPNLALMKISAYHKSKGDTVDFADMFGVYDIIYKSKIFSWTIDPEYAYNTKKYIKGGTGFDIQSKLPKKIDQMLPDYNLYNCKSAYGFLTRGCIRKCPECIVPQKEGKIKKYMDIKEIIGDKKSAILMDNNVLASKHGLKQIEKIIDMKIKIDFNQGLDARLIDNEKAKLLSKVKWLQPLRMSCDHENQIPAIEKAVKLLRKHNCTPSRYFAYVLVKDIESSLKRVLFLDKLNVRPFAQAYRDLKNTPVPRIQKIFCEWVNKRSCFKSCTFEEFKATRY